MKYHNKGGYISDRSDYTEWITGRASRFNELKSASKLKCGWPNKAVYKLVYKVVDGLKSNKDSKTGEDASKAIKFFNVLEDIRWNYSNNYGSRTTIKSHVRQYKNNKFNLTDIIKDINNEIKVQCDKLVEKGSNNCYKYMNTEIKEGTKKIFYDQIGSHIGLTYSSEAGGSLFDDFSSPDEKEFQDFVKKVSASEESAPPPLPPVDAPADGDADPLAEQSGGRRRRRRTASKRRSGKRRVTRKRSSKRRGGKKSVSKAGKRKTMKRKQ